MNEKQLKAFTALPPSSSCRIIAFKEAEVRPGFVTGTWFLIVRGVKPWVTMHVELDPLFYITRPEYWGIEVVGCQKGIGLPVTAPYDVAIEITHFIGSKGIEVIGATSKKKIKVST
jgi:hypothetical protein